MGSDFSITMEYRLDKDDLLTHSGPNQEVNPLSTSQDRSSCWVSLLHWVLCLGFAIFALYGWARMGYAILNWYWLTFSGIHPGPLYIAVTGGLWGLAGLIALAWILLRLPWHRLVGLSAALFFVLTYWIDRLFIAADPGSSSNTLFAALFTLILLVYAILVLRPLGEIYSLLHK
jgi:hypothetical protein